MITQLIRGLINCLTNLTLVYLGLWLLSFLRFCCLLSLTHILLLFRFLSLSIAAIRTILVLSILLLLLLRNLLFRLFFLLTLIGTFVVDLWLVMTCRLHVLGESHIISQDFTTNLTGALLSVSRFFLMLGQGLSSSTELLSTLVAFCWFYSLILLLEFSGCLTLRSLGLLASLRLLLKERTSLIVVVSLLLRSWLYELSRGLSFHW